MKQLKVALVVALGLGIAVLLTLAVVKIMHDVEYVVASGISNMYEMGEE